LECPMLFDCLQAWGKVMCEYGTRLRLKSCERKSETDQNQSKTWWPSALIRWV
jgi:hypothetical protein